jgi:uncharacterized protein YdhG (YjbR/CyaY superfamily)
MRQYPKNRREIQNTGPDDSRSALPETVDAYIAAQPERIQSLLQQVRNTIRSMLPEAEERIVWRMPTYRKEHNIIHFAAFQNHLGIYPGDRAMAHFADRLTEYKTSKGALQLPYSKPLPLELIAEITRWCYENGAEASN